MVISTAFPSEIVFTISENKTTDIAPTIRHMQQARTLNAHMKYASYLDSRSILGGAKDLEFVGTYLPEPTKYNSRKQYDRSEMEEHNSHRSSKHKDNLASHA